MKELLFINPTQKLLNQKKLKKILEEIPELQYSSHQYFLSTEKYINHIPEKFYDKTLYHLYLSWLNNKFNENKNECIQYFNTEKNNLSKAFENLAAINNKEIHEIKLKTNNIHETLKYIDDTINPLILNLVEASYSHLLKPISYFHRFDKKVSNLNLSLHDIIGDVSRTKFKDLVIDKIDNIRNGIAHRGIKYGINDITYSDKKNNSITLDYFEIIDIFDSLMDICNSISLAIKIFLLIHLGTEIELPNSLLFEEISEETKNKWLHVTDCIEVIIPKGNQLIIYTNPNTTDRNQILFLTIQIAIIAEFLAPNYNRYCINYNSKKCYSGCCIFDGEKIHNAITSNINDYSDYINAIEDTGLFFNPKYKLPKLFYKVDTFLGIFGLMFLNNKKNEVSYFVIRDIEKTKVKNRIRLMGTIILSSNIRNHSDWIKENASKIIKKTVKKTKTIFPIEYIQISIFSQDYRKRNFSSYKTKDSLICTIILNKSKYIKTPQIINTHYEKNKNLNFFWS